MEKRWTPKGWEWNIEGTWTLGRKAPPFTSFITPKPSPFAWPAKLSTEISKYPELVDPELFAQAKSYSSHIQRLTAEGFTPAAAAKTLQQRGYRFFGWSKKLLSTIQAPSIPPQQLTPEFISRWNREALLTRLSTAVKQGPFEPVPMPEFYRGIAGRAGRFGLGQELLSRMGPATPEMLSEMISPSPWYQKATRVGKGFGEQIWRAPTGFKVGLGLAIGLLGLYALQPGSYFNGFSESGIGPQKRKELTDFGSGYKGLDFNRDDTVSPVERKFGRFARALKKYGVEAGTAHKRIYIPKDIVSEEELTKELGFIPVKIAIPEAGQSRFESFRHPNVLYHLHEHDDVWVMHEDVHPSATMVFKKWMAEKARGAAVTVGGLTKGVWASMSHIIEEGIPGAYYYLKGLASETDDMRQRIEKEVSAKYKGLVKRWRKEFSKENVFSGFGRAYNNIEGLFHGGQAEKKRRELTDFGSGWRGLFGGIGKLFTRTVRPFTFAGRVERVYKGLIKSSLKAQGISTRNLVWDYTDILEKGALDITLMAKTKAGDPLAMITRILSPQEVYLTSVEVGVQGAGLGKQIYSREALALRKLGYKTGTRIVSPVSSPITARWQAQLYGSQSVNKLAEDDFINRLIKGKITKQEFQSKYAGEFVGELRFSGFQEQGFSSLFRKKYGFGSGAIWKKILTFSRRLFASSTSKTSFEKLTSAMTEAEVANIFGREVASFNPAQIRSGLMDKWYIERKLGLPQEVVTRSPAQIRKEMEAGERLYRQQVVSGKIFSRNELRTMNEVEWADIRNRAIAKKEAQRQKNALKNAQIKEQIMGAEQKAQKIKKQNTLHLKAQQDFWKNSVKTGRGHVVKSSNTTVA